MAMLKYLLEKEFKQLIRNSFLPRMIVLMPCMVMLLMPWAADLEIKNIRLAMVDKDKSSLSQRLVHKVAASSYFSTTSVGTYDEALETVESGKTDAILEIPRGFEKQIERGENTSVQIAVNTVNGTKGGLAGSYLNTIITDYSRTVAEARNGTPKTRPVTVEKQYRYNPHLNYKYFMVPALMVMLLTLICGALPSLNVVGEKEAGTMEQINVTPVSKFSFILAKLLPYWVVGFVALTISFVLAYVVYGLWPAGSFGLLYPAAFLFVLTISGFGLVVSNYSSTMQQAMFVMWFCMLILILLSGLFTPISGMPEWARLITWFNPLNYFMQIMRSIYLKGSVLSELSMQYCALLGFAVVANVLAVLSYRKR